MKWLLAALLMSPLAMPSAVGQAKNASADGRPQTIDLNAPLPPVKELQARAIAEDRKMAETLERYVCRELYTDYELDGNGNVKKINTTERESFFVNGHEIVEAVAFHGRPLSDKDQQAVQAAVKKAIAAAAGGPPVKRSEGLFSSREFLMLDKLTNGRRILLDGRPTLVFDAAGDPAVKTDNTTQRILATMAGTIAIDERTGMPQEVTEHGTRDLKIGGGILAYIHKDFHLHFVAAPQPDGVWLLKTFDAGGDARVGFFFHPRVKMLQQGEGCTLATVTTDSTVNIPKPPQPK